MKAASYQAYQVKPGCWNVSHVTPDVACQVVAFGIVDGDDDEAKARAEDYATRGNAGDFDEREAWRIENKPPVFGGGFTGSIEIAEPALSQGVVCFEEGDRVIQRAARRVNGDWQAEYYWVPSAETRAQTTSRLREEQQERELNVRADILRGFFGEPEGLCYECQEAI